MASVRTNIVGPQPYSLSVKKVGDSTERFVSHIGNLLTFTADTTDQTILYEVKISNTNCSYTTTFGMNCGIDLDIPNYDIAFQQPYCIGNNTYQPGKIILTNITNATRYKICYNTGIMNCAPCSESDGLINSTTANIIVNTPNAPATVDILLRVYNGDSCTAYKESFFTMIVPECTPACHLQIGVGTPNCGMIPYASASGVQPYTYSIKTSGDNTERFINRDGNDGTAEIHFTPKNSGVLETYTLKVTDANGCVENAVFTATCYSTLPEPDFQYDLVDPYCSAAAGGTIQNAVLKLKNITNATRYKICYNSATFSSACQSACSSSDGFITGSNVDISIIAPAEGSYMDVTVRVFNGESCLYYKDQSIRIYSQKCNTDETTLIYMDLQVFSQSSGVICDQESTYLTKYNFYLTPNATGLESINGLKALVGNTSERNIPNGNSVPNIYVSAPFKASCGSPGTAGNSITSTFYRFAINLAKLKANFPLVDNFTFDVYGERTRNDSPANGNTIRVIRNTFHGVSLINQLYSNNSNDATRNPTYPGSSAQTDKTYTGSGMQKIGTINYNKISNLTTWVNA